MPGLLDLFLPVSCGGCGMPAEPDASAADALVCPGCRAALRGPASAGCSVLPEASCWQ